MLKKLPLTIASTLALSGFYGSVHAQHFDALHVLGDSLSDGGTYSQAVMAGGAPATTTGGAPMRYRFLDNRLDGTSQTYAEALADKLNLPLEPAVITGVPAAGLADITLGGSNYAQGGSRVSDPAGIGNSPLTGITTLPVSTQVDRLLAANSTLGSKDLIILWAGANDVFYQTAAVGAGLPVANAVANMNTAASDMRTQVDRLKAAGASNIMVITLPDIGNNTPAGVLQGGATQTLYSTLSDAFNNQLLSVLGGTNAVIVDADKMLTAVLDDPTNYGFSGINQRTAVNCTTTSSLQCLSGVTTIAGDFVFADGVHPTTQTHQLLAEAAFAGLQAIAQNAAISVGTLTALRQQSIGLDNRLNSGAFYRQDAQGNKLRRNSGHVEVYGGIEAGFYEVDAGQIRPQIEGNTQIAKLAADIMLSPSVVLGGGVSLDQGEVDFGAAHGGFDSRLVTAALFGVVELRKGLYANFSAAYGDIDVHDIERRFTLGPATERYTASSQGHYQAASFGVGAMFPLSEQWLLNPTLKYTAEKVQIDGYDESFGAVSLSFGDQSYEGQRASLGLASFYRPAGLAGSVLSLRASLEHDFNDEPIRVGVGPTSANLATVETARDDRTYGYVSARAAYAIQPSTSLVLSASKVVALENNSGYTLGLSLVHEL